MPLESDRSSNLVSPRPHRPPLNPPAAAVCCIRRCCPCYATYSSLPLSAPCPINSRCCATLQFEGEAVPTPSPARDHSGTVCFPAGSPLRASPQKRSCSRQSRVQFLQPGLLAFAGEDADVAPEDDEVVRDGHAWVRVTVGTVQAVDGNSRGGEGSGGSRQGVSRFAASGMSLSASSDSRNVSQRFSTKPPSRLARDSRVRAKLQG